MATRFLNSHQMAKRFLKISSNGNKFFKKNLANGNKILKSKTDDSALLHDNFQFFISIFYREVMEAWYALSIMDQWVPSTWVYS